MFEIVTGSRIPFMRYRRWAYGLSLLIILAGVASLAVKGGFRLGVDFAGGSLVEYRFDRHIDTEEFRRIVADAGFPQSEIQASEGGATFMIRIAEDLERESGEASASEKIMAAARNRIPGLQGELLLEEHVGPRVGRELRGAAFLAVLISLFLIMIYVTVRYDLRTSVAGIAALAHDLLIVLAFISIFNKEITIAVIAALLTIGGYSINDKIVVFDRVRERRRGAGRQEDEAMIDLSLNQTLSRTIITGLCVIFSLEALLFMGGPVIHDFAWAMLLGVLFGTYSSIFIGSGLVLDMVLRTERRREAREALAGKLKA